MSRDCIIGRIEAALEKMRAQRMEVRALYLTVEDNEAHNAAMNALWNEKQGRTDFDGRFLSFGDHPIRIGQKSVIYSTHGVAVAIPKRLSPRTQAAA